MQEEREVLVRNILITVTAQLLVKLLGLLTTREGIGLDLMRDLFGSIRDEDGGLVRRCTHLSFGALEGGEETAVDESGLLPAESRRNIARHAEVRVLVDGAGNEALDVLSAAKDLREAGGEGGSSLNGRETVFSDMVRIRETEGTTGLVASNGSGDLGDGRIEVLDVVCVLENKSLRNIKTACNNILSILKTKTASFFKSQITLPVEFFIISELDHKRNVENTLQPLGELEWHQMAEMESIRRGATTSIQVERFTLFVHIENVLHIAV